MPHIVDTLIEERARGLMRHPLLWRLVTRLLYPALGYRAAVNMANSVAHMGGLEIFEMLSAQLQLDIDIGGTEHIPETGSAIVTPNHPTGIADGVAVFDALRTVRSDITFFANRDAIRFAPGLADVIVTATTGDPLHWYPNVGGGSIGAGVVIPTGLLTSASMAKMTVARLNRKICTFMPSVSSQLRCRLSTMPRRSITMA